MLRGFYHPEVTLKFFNAFIISVIRIIATGIALISTAKPTNYKEFQYEHFLWHLFLV
jgi:hypothetical protein